MKKIIVVFCVFAFCVQLHGQELSKIEKEVWETVETYSEKSHQRNYEAYISFFHPEFVGWHEGGSRSTNLESRSRGLKYWFDSTESLMYKLELHSVKVFDDIAIVHYSNRIVNRDKESKEESFNMSKWTDVLKKEKGKWLLIADHGG